MSKFLRKALIVEATQAQHNHLLTAEGSNHLVRAGDWVIIGIDGKKYSVSDDVFKLLYDPVEDSEKQEQPQTNARNK